MDRPRNLTLYLDEPGNHGLSFAILIFAVGVVALRPFQFIENQPLSNGRYAMPDGLRGFLTLSVFVSHPG